MRRIFGLRQVAIASCLLCLCLDSPHLAAQAQEQPHVVVPTFQPEALVPLTNGHYLELTGPETIGPRVPNVGQYFATVYEMPAANTTTGTAAGGVGPNFNFMPNPLLGEPKIFAKATFDEGDFHLRALDFEGSAPANIDIQDTSTTAALQYNNANVTVSLTVVVMKNGKPAPISGPSPIVIKDGVRVDGNVVRVPFGPYRQADPQIDGTVATELRKALATRLFPSLQAEELAITATIVFGRTPDIASAGGSSSGSDPSFTDPTLEKAWKTANDGNAGFQKAATAAIRAHAKAVADDPEKLQVNDEVTRRLIDVALTGIAGEANAKPTAIPEVLSPDDVYRANAAFAQAVNTPGLITSLTANAFQKAVTAGATAQTAVLEAKIAAQEVDLYNNNFKKAFDDFNAGRSLFFDSATRLDHWRRLATQSNAKATQALDTAAKALGAMTKAYVAFANGSVQSDTSSLDPYKATVANSLALDLGRLNRLPRPRVLGGLPPHGT